VPFVVLQLLVLAICFVWPDLILWLPKAVYAN
jgi:TRAP-type mannitol/chloroaromatic compound transport system permease large subunit